MITKYRALVHPDHVNSNFHAHRCSWCNREMERTGKTEKIIHNVILGRLRTFYDVEMIEIACPHASKHVEDQERWAKLSEGGQAE